MLHYFHLLRAAFFQDIFRPALTQSWARRSFAPCAGMSKALQEQGAEVPDGCLVQRASAGLVFSRHAWQGVFGECLLFGSVDLPRLPTAPATLCCLLAPQQYMAGAPPRSGFAPIQQAHLGSRDLHCGGFYRPDHAGYNDDADVVRLHQYLQAQNPRDWSADALAPLPDLLTAEDRAEELAYVRDWWSPLVEMYGRAAREDLIIACEEM